MLLSCFKTTASSSLSTELLKTSRFAIQGPIPTYPHDTDKTDYEWLPNVVFHLHAFLFIVLSFWMVTLHFCPANFYSSCKMCSRGHLLHETFLLLPTRYNFIFPRTLTSFCNTVGTCHVLPHIICAHVSRQLWGQASNLIYSCISSKHCLWHFMVLITGFI